MISIMLQDEAGRLASGIDRRFLSLECPLTPYCSSGKGVGGGGFERKWRSVSGALYSSPMRKESWTTVVTGET